MTRKRVPEFSSDEEEARFWDETSLDELEDGELEEVEVERPSQPLPATLAVRFDEQTLGTLRKIAEQRGLGVTQLVRSWTMERLGRERRFRPDSVEEIPVGRVRKRLEQALEELVPEAVDRALGRPRRGHPREEG